MASTLIRQTAISGAKLILVKIGTNVVTAANGRLDRRLIARLAGQIAEHHSAGRRFVVVSSGAIGMGMGELGLKERPTEMNELQALAAIGQRHLMTMFAAAFGRHGLHAAQLLLTRDDFDDRRRYLNIRSTIAQLHRLDAIPVINENDPIAVDEIRFGDNDMIAALTANLLRAELTIILSIVDGLLDRRGQVIDLVDRAGPDVGGFVRKEKSSLGSGGMRSKLDAIQKVTDAGEVAMIANGRRPDVLSAILRAERVGTVFLPAARKLTSRDRWIGLTARPAGSVTIDAGAVRALVANHKSLLPGGVTAVRGQFERGDVIAVLAGNGEEVARGIARYSADEVEAIKGCKTSQIADRLGAAKPCDEIIHRDWLVVLGQ
jgi:glutamate 5-kinase